MPTKSYEGCIIGAGPAGWGAAIELVKHGVTNLLIIDKNKTVGGLARTEKFGPARFDVGPHRFFTKNREINRLWHDTLGTDFKPVNRLTRIYYNKNYFRYPISAGETLLKLGPIEALHIILSFISTRFEKNEEPKTFEDWITQKFGRKLYLTFFKTYTEKVWGIPCSQIGAEWAAQRIKGLDIVQTLKKAIRRQSRQNIKTLVEQFDYPVLGAGQMYETMCDQVVAAGADVMLNSRVIAFNNEHGKISSIDVLGPDGQPTQITADHFFNSIPMTHFFQILNPAETAPIQAAVQSLYYREHITVNLLVDGDDIFPDQWIYIHSPDVQMARLANYNNFSKAMVGAKNKSALSVEYFVFQDEDIWKMSDDAIRELAIEELDFIGLVKKNRVEQSWVVRETESYPTYYIGFKASYDLLISRLSQFSNLSAIGRGGMYKYNNQDHSTLSGILAARNYLKLHDSPYNLWDINIDAEYHEGEKRRNAVHL
jgi:protoporphyrinogen oxidase